MMRLLLAAVTAVAEKEPENAVGVASPALDRVSWTNARLCASSRTLSTINDPDVVA